MGHPSWDSTGSLERTSRAGHHLPSAERHFGPALPAWLKSNETRAAAAVFFIAAGEGAGTAAAAIGVEQRRS